MTDCQSKTNLPDLQELSAFESLPPIAGGWATKDYRVGTCSLTLTLPAQPDALLDDPEVLAAHEIDGYMPYWGYLWPTSLETAAALLREAWPPNTTFLELGAGIGVSGLAALSAGLPVTFSDYDQQAVRLALFNARQNGFAAARGLMLDWRNPGREKFSLIVGCDVIYEVRNHAPILDVLEAMLDPNGVCWITDPGRHQADPFVQQAKARGFSVTLEQLAREPFPSRPAGVTHLWRLSNPAKRP